MTVLLQTRYDFLSTPDAGASVNREGRSSRDSSCNAPCRVSIAFPQRHAKDAPKGRNMAAWGAVGAAGAAPGIAAHLSTPPQQGQAL